MLNPNKARRSRPSCNGSPATILGLLVAACGGPEARQAPAEAPPATRRQALDTVRPTDRPRGLSPKLFVDGGQTYAPMDIDAQVLALDFDAEARVATGVAAISFHQNLTSRPVFLLGGVVDEIRLNGRPLPYRLRVSDPDRKNLLVVVDEELPAGVPQELVVRYTLRSNAVRFDGSGVGFLTDMSDVEPAVYFERWGPVSFEDDQFPLTLHVALRNATSPHLFFTNGTEDKPGDGEWHVQFPPHFTASSFFVHLTNQRLAVRQTTYPGLLGDIALTTYSPSEAIADTALRSLPGYFSELEATFGPYLNRTFVAYVVDSGGGMEYTGATITSQRALNHELGHSWFARGVMPADGRSQWIDEGIVTWRDGGYAAAAALLASSPTNLGNYSHYMRGMPYYVHSHAARLMSEWELLFGASGGLKPLLRTFFERYGRRVVTTDEFRAFLEGESGVDLDAYFRRYVTGDPPLRAADSPADAEDEAPSYHVPLTEAEIAQLR